MQLPRSRGISTNALLVPGCLLTLGCTPVPATDRQHADSVAVHDIATGIIAADNARDLDRVLGYYADDAMLLPPNEPPVTGTRAIRPRYERLFEGYQPAIEDTVEEIVVVGDLAYVRGHNGGRLQAIGSGADRSLNDVYLMILRKTEGRWEIDRLMWHPGGGPGSS